MFAIAADDEWNGWKRLGDPVLHIDLRNWADALVVAPLSAHSLAKFSSGLCDDPLSCCVRAWDFGHGNSSPLNQLKPIFLAPAMNTIMWNHPLTHRQLSGIQSFSTSSPSQVVIVEPKKESKLACGEIGAGAMADVSDIILAVKNHFGINV